MLVAVMLRPVIAVVAFARFPIEVELALANTVADPIESHVDGFGSALFYFVIDDALTGSIVRDYGGCRLRVAKEFTGGPERDRFLAVVKDSSNFGFCG